MKIKASRNPTKVKEPRPEAFNLPTTLVAPEHSPVLRHRSDSIRFVRCDHLDAKLSQLSIQHIRVVSAVTNQALRLLNSETLLKSLSDKGDFMRRSSRRVDGERKTMKVCQTHELRAFAPLGGAHSAPLFLATTNVPSIKHSDKSISPRSSRSRASASKTLRNVSSRDHCWNLLWQVWYGGNFSGKSCQREPLRSIQCTPLITSRVSFHGRPRPSSRRGGSGISGPIIAHCSSVSSSPRLFAMLEGSMTRYL